ncbi:hypothetical protein MRX96_027454 [Rhipicephalus microplus]
MSEDKEVKPVHGMFAVPAPPAFDFDRTSEWPSWIQLFDDYRFASGLNERSEEAQVRTLLYTMGRQAREIFSTFTLSEQQQKQRPSNDSSNSCEKPATNLRQRQPATWTRSTNNGSPERILQDSVPAPRQAPVHRSHKVNAPDHSPTDLSHPVRAPTAVKESTRGPPARHELRNATTAVVPDILQWCVGKRLQASERRYRFLLSI